MDKTLRNAMVAGTFLVAFSISYYFAIVLPKNNPNSSFGADATTELERAFDDFGSMIKVNLCKQAFDKYVTNSSKEKKGFDNFQYHCRYRSEDWSNFEIQNMVLSDDSRADIRYSVDIETADFDSTKFKECSNRCFSSSPDRSCLEMCEGIAPKILKNKEWVETWIFEDGLWKRDY